MAIFILVALMLVSFLLVGILLDASDRSKDDFLYLNGVRFGDVFKLLFEDDKISLYLDMYTGVLYLASEDGICALLDEKGKPQKYKGLDDIVRTSKRKGE